MLNSDNCSGETIGFWRAVLDFGRVGRQRAFWDFLTIDTDRDVFFQDPCRSSDSARNLYGNRLTI